jgi:hypothetical protein
MGSSILSEEDASRGERKTHPSLTGTTSSLVVRVGRRGGEVTTLGDRVLSLHSPSYTIGRQMISIVRRARYEGREGSRKRGKGEI